MAVAGYNLAIVPGLAVVLLELGTSGGVNTKGSEPALADWAVEHGPASRPHDQHVLLDARRKLQGKPLVIWPVGD